MRVCNPDLPITRLWTAKYIRRYDPFSDAESIISELSTTFLVAAYFGFHELVKIMLPHGERGCLDDESPLSSRTALSWASEQGRQKVVQSLLEQEAKLSRWSWLSASTTVTRADKSLRPPIRYAADKGHTEIVRLLLYYGARINDVDTHQGTFLSRAIRRRHFDLVELLISHDTRRGSNLQKLEKGGDTSICQAAEAGDEGLVQLFLQYGEKVDATDQFGESALSVSLASGHLKVAKLLVDRGANIDAMGGSKKRTILTRASALGHKETVNAALDCGADINATDGSGRTGLICAIDGRQKETINLLLERGAKVGKTTLIYATETRLNEAVGVLLEHGADPDVSDSGRCTALIWAAKIDNCVAARLLLQSGADIEVRDREGKTALMWALDRKHETLAKLLYDRTAANK